MIHGDTANVQEITTTDNTIQECCRIPLPESCMGILESYTIGMRRSDGSCYGARRTGYVKRAGSGSVQIVGAIQKLAGDQRDNALNVCDVIISVDGNDLVVSVQGLSGDTIDWYTKGTLDGFYFQ